jgi:dihydroneopterin aldolase
MDRITLRGIRASGRHGVSAQERANAQPFDVDLVLELDVEAASRADDITETVDYARLHERVVAVVADTSFALLERLARAILEAAFEDDRIARGEVTVSKPNVLAGATPSVTLARSNDRARSS